MSDAQSLHVLHENAAGYALFAIPSFEEIGRLIASENGENQNQNSIIILQSLFFHRFDTLSTLGYLFLCLSLITTIYDACFDVYDRYDWSREEDEKLLHLAKLLPAQWRTIGPLVGRTASQCQERYEALLDEAAGGGEGGAAAAGGAAAGLRVGDIDTHPETKPARPDPIDMDEDEIEMLQEARARLANTQGKKAKRKQREKMLNEAKRLADLQKRRELKQAGLLSSRMRRYARRRGKKGRREIDLGVEIPFHKPAPAGFHDTSSEKELTEQLCADRLRDVNTKKINEQQYRTRDREAALAKKKEEARLRALEKANAALAVAKVSEKNDPVSERKRAALNLPAPTVSDKELSDVAKLSKSVHFAQFAEGVVGGEGGEAATAALLSDYKDRPLPTPMRTPQVGASSGLSSREMVMREASNLRAMERGETPLLGGLNPDLYDTRSTAVNDTPSVNDTPLDRKSVNQTPRDHLSLHQHTDDNVSVANSGFYTLASNAKQIAREERRAAKRARAELERALASLPAPQFEYELAVPEDSTIQDDDKEEKKMDAALLININSAVPDARDVEQEKQQKMREEVLKRERGRSEVVKRDLPRVTRIGKQVQAAKRENEKETEAEQLIWQEMQQLVAYDAQIYPLEMKDQKKKKKKKNKKRKARDDDDDDDDVATESKSDAVQLDLIPEEELQKARDALLADCEVVLQEARVKQQQRHDHTDNDSSINIYSALISNNIQISLSNASNMLYKNNSWSYPSKHNENDNNSNNHSSVNNKSQRLAALKEEYQILNSAIIQLKKKNDKLESKLSIKHGGYNSRSQSLSGSIKEHHFQLQQACIEEEVFEYLESLERKAVETRVEDLEEDVKRMESVEKEGQKRYGELLHERQRVEVMERKRIEGERKRRDED